MEVGDRASHALNRGRPIIQSADIFGGVTSVMTSVVEGDDHGELLRDKPSRLQRVARAVGA